MYINKLKDMNWGLAGLYVQVLEKLVEEEANGREQSD